MAGKQRFQVRGPFGDRGGDNRSRWSVVDTMRDNTAVDYVARKSDAVDSAHELNSAPEPDVPWVVLDHEAWSRLDGEGWRCTVNGEIWPWDRLLAYARRAEHDIVLPGKVLG